MRERLAHAYRRDDGAIVGGVQRTEGGQLRLDLRPKVLQRPGRVKVDGDARRAPVDCSVAARCTLWPPLSGEEGRKVGEEARVRRILVQGVNLTLEGQMLEDAGERGAACLADVVQ